jgi:multidrug resistance protein MdtO
MDSITSLVVLEGVVAFISAWVAAGPKFNYIGLQMAFSFYVVAYEGLSAPTELAPARDRLAGILIAFAAMWLVFDQLWPVRTITVMRRGFASVLRLGADLLNLLDSGKAKEEILQGADVLRDRLGKTVAGLRSSNTAVPYDFSPDRDRHIQEGDAILRATLTAAALFWNEIAMLHSLQEAEVPVEPARRELRDHLAARMIVMADLVAQHRPVEPESTPEPPNQALLADPQLGEYTEHLMARHAELEKFVAALN